MYSSDGASNPADRDEMFAGKKFVRLILARSSCPLKFNERLVYSYLLYRRQQDGETPVTITRVAEVTGLDRGTAAASAIRALVELELVREAPGGYTATDRLPDWLVVRKDGTIATFNLYLPSPSSPLTPKQNGVYWTLWSLAYKSEDGRTVTGQTSAGIAALIGVEERYCSKDSERRGRYGAFTSLERLGLLDRDRETGTFALRPITPEQLGWWLDTKPKQKAQAVAKTPSPKPEGQAVRPTRAKAKNLWAALDWQPGPRDKPDDWSILEEYSIPFADEKLAMADLTLNERVSYLNHVRQLATLGAADVIEFISHGRLAHLISEAESLHARNGRSGSCLNLLKSLTQKKWSRCA